METIPLLNSDLYVLVHIPREIVSPLELGIALYVDPALAVELVGCWRPFEFKVDGLAWMHGLSSLLCVEEVYIVIRGWY